MGECGGYFSSMECAYSSDVPQTKNGWPSEEAARACLLLRNSCRAILEQKWLHGYWGRADMFFGIACATRRDDVMQCMIATLRQWRDVVLGQVSLCAFLAVIATMIVGNLHLDPLRMREVADCGTLFEGSTFFGTGSAWFWVGLCGSSMACVNFSTVCCVIVGILDFLLDSCSFAVFYAVLFVVLGMLFAPLLTFCIAHFFVFTIVSA